VSNLPLDGITVVSIEQAVAAPFATRQLADLGARVIKIEREAGDFARGYDDKVLGQASYFVWLNRSKESIVLDLKNPEDAEVAKQLLAEADVFVQNLAPGAIEKLGLGAEALQAVNPKLIHVSISGYGRGGPMEHKKAYDLLIQCESGLLSVTGTPEQETKVGVSIADIASGMYAYTGVLSALIQRGKTGRGDVIEISMLEALGEWMQQPELYARYSGQAPPRTGASHASIAPYGPFAAADGTVFMGIQNEREWAKFCEGVLQRPELTTHADYASNSLRTKNVVALRALIEEAFSALTVQQVLERLDQAAIANAELRSAVNVGSHPQLAARDRWIEVDTPAGEVRVQRPPVTSREQGLRVGPVPTIGQHSELIRQQLRDRADAGQ
jgi:crotonobetainyl-CoA:carnitine CoA-transferase CaiB-like acyl-CoA transferase